VAILAEYDALPEIGHACGHNLIGTGAVGAFLGLAAVADRLGSEVVLLGTPGEEGGGGKIKLLDAGAFAGIDAAMMFHPLDRDLLTNPALASEWILFSFTGRPAHAAASPWEGSSALSAVIQTFNLIDSQRVHFRDGARVHGFITNGGQAVNIIPERAACQFSVRAPRAGYLGELAARVVDCARAAAMAARVELTVDRRPGYKDLRNNMTLARVFGEALASLGRSAAETDPSTGAGSTDMGDVSLDYRPHTTSRAARWHRHAGERPAAWAGSQKPSLKSGEWPNGQGQLLQARPLRPHCRQGAGKRC
jgi:amidohydrolase